MVTAWLITLPSAGIVGATTYYLVHGIGGYAGAAIGFGLLIAVATGIWLKSRQAPITHKNVTHEWQGNLTAASIENLSNRIPRRPRRSPSRSPKVTP